MEKNIYNILIYYCYTPINNPGEFRRNHHLFCIKNNLRGRIIVSKEGLNGTISGLKKDCDTYISKVKSDPRFKEIEFKKENHHKHVFKKLNVRLKNEVVYSGLPDDVTVKNRGTYIEPSEFRTTKDALNTHIVDVRSDYEYKQGTFKNSITFDINNFRNFSHKIDELKPYRSKKLILVCTAGVKCEKASAYLKLNGFENVYQLHGGIIKYGLETDGKDFDGECYVFDERVSIPINKANPKIINKCYICKTPCQRMINCANASCNLHVPICKDCALKLEGSCSEKCKNTPHKRTYDGTGYYTTKLNGYNPLKGVNR